MADTVFNTFKQFSLNGEFDLLNEEIRVVLLSAAPDIDSDTYYSDIISSEITAVGYDTSGIALTGNAVGILSGSNVAYFDADDVSWYNSTITASYAAIFQTMGPSTISKLIGYLDFGGSVSSQNGEFSIQWNENGILWIRPES